MHDSELKKLLLETHPIRPGQEERAWLTLKKRLAPKSPWAWLYYPTWRGAVASMAVIGTVAVLLNLITMRSPSSFASADSQTPGVYATSFYSNSAHAQVVWLNGMDPVSDKPTYLDPTSVITGTPTTEASRTTKTSGDPNSL
jgi:hypothetical protein